MCTKTRLFDSWTGPERGDARTHKVRALLYQEAGKTVLPSHQGKLAIYIFGFASGEVLVRTVIKLMCMGVLHAWASFERENEIARQLFGT